MIILYASNIWLFHWQIPKTVSRMYLDFFLKFICLVIMYTDRLMLSRLFCAFVTNYLVFYILCISQFIIFLQYLCLWFCCKIIPNSGYFNLEPISLFSMMWLLYKKYVWLIFLNCVSNSTSFYGIIQSLYIKWYCI